MTNRNIHDGERSCRPNILALCVLLCSFQSALAQPDYRYALFNLESIAPGEQFNSALGIDSSGRVAGLAAVGPSSYHAAMWNLDGSVNDLGTLGGDNSHADDINELGDLVGWANHEPGGSAFRHRAVLWRSGQIIDLGTLGGVDSEAEAINNLGQIVGAADYDPKSGVGEPFIWENGVMRALANIGRRSGEAYDINDQRQIVGTLWTTDNLYQRPILWENDVPINLPDLGRSPSAALAINELGQIVGQSKTQREDTHACIWIDRQIIDLHTPGYGQSSSAWGINNVGQVVGWVGSSGLNPQAFIRNPGEPMRLLIDLSPPRLRESWRLQVSQGVNDAGQVVAYGIINGHPLTPYAFLLSPVTPTMSLGAPSPGTAGVANTITVTNATPGARVTFLYSRFGGGERIPGCDLQQNALQLDSPTVIGTAIADQNGVATITRTVPPIARGQTILFQAVVQNECAISQLVVFRFE